MPPIDGSKYEKSRKKLTQILTDIARHAQTQSLTRCPYKNKLDQCTAQFGCRNKRKPIAESELPACASDDRLDYRSAWEVDPQSYEFMHQKLQASCRSRERNNHRGTFVSHEDRHVPAVTGKTIFDYADELNVRVPTSCGRTGHCHECIVEIRRGSESITAPTEAESFLNAPFRLACQAIVENTKHEIDFSILRRTPKILLAPKDAGPIDLDPAIVRHGDHVYHGDQQIDQVRGTLYGLAIDVGTTTVVAILVDLETGQSVYEFAFENPQRFGGSDVMHRISYDAGQYHGELHQAIINTVNGEIRQLCDQIQITRRQIYEIVVVGNATMRDLFFNLDVQSIGQKPYKSSIEHEYLQGTRKTTTLNVSARKLGLYVHPKARVFGGPLIASHVGADVVADLLAVDIASHSELVMLVDVGTNTEIVIGNRDRLICASCPAGPAFEGGLVTFGMPGCEGAIESINYVDNRFEYKTIDNTRPRGICGSGLIDLLATLRRHDLMTPKGVFINRKTHFDVVPEHGITLSRRDASELAQAKAANTCGQVILMRHFGIHPNQIHKLYLAGGFANYVNPASAVEIGMLAPVPLDRIVKVGNSAIQGACQMLRSLRRRREIEQLAKTIEHVELETTPDFFDIFVEACQIKPMQLTK